MSNSHRARRALLQERLKQLAVLEQLHIAQATNASQRWHMRQRIADGVLPAEAQVALELEERSLHDEAAVLARQIAELRATIALPAPALRLPDLPALHEWVVLVSAADLDQISMFYEYIWKMERRLDQLYWLLTSYVPFVEVPVHLLLRLCRLELQSIDTREQLVNRFAKLQTAAVVDPQNS